MDTVTRHSVPAQALADDAFSPYGNIIKPRRSGDQGDRAYAYSRNERNHVALEYSNGEPMIRIMHQVKRGMTFSKVARHMHVTQCLGSLQGKEWFIAVAAPTSATDTQLPPLDKFTAFKIPGDRIIKLHIGTWHAGPHFVHDECMFMSFENVDTNTKDFDLIALPVECRIEDQLQL